MPAIEDGSCPSHGALSKRTPSSGERSAWKAMDIGAFQRRLVTDLLRTNGLGAAVGLMAEELGCSVHVLRADGSPLASSAGSANLPANRLVPKVPARASGKFEPERLGSWLFAPVAHDDQVLGWLVVDDARGAHGEERLVRLEAATTILALHLAGRATPSAAPPSYGDLALAILHGGPSAAAQRLADRLGYDLDRQHVVAALSGLDEVEDPVMLVQQAARQVGAGTPLVARPGDRLFVLSAEQVSWNLFCPAVTRLGGGSVHVGVSAIHPLDEISEAINEALFALEFGRPSRGQFVTRVSELGVWQLVLESSSTERLRRFVKDWIGPLVDYDQRHQTELVKTLRTYLWESCSSEATAAALYVHRNTLRYRLSRCEQVLGLDLADQENRFQLSIACGAHEVLPVRQRLDAALREIAREGSETARPPAVPVWRVGV